MIVANMNNIYDKYFVIHDKKFKKTLLQYLLAEINLYFGINKNQCWCSTYFNGIKNNLHNKKCPLWFAKKLTIYNKKNIKLICNQIGDIPDIDIGSKNYYFK